jgi:hypothetical protein
MGLVDLGPQKDIFPAFDEDTRFRLVAGRHQSHGDKGRRRDDQRRPDNRAFSAPNRAGNRAEVHFLIGRSRWTAVLDPTTHANPVLDDSGGIPPSAMSADYGCYPVKPRRELRRPPRGR